jgi:hypothetical protein
MSTSSLISKLFKGGVDSPKPYREYVVPEHVKDVRRFTSNVTLGRTKEANDIILAIKKAKRRYLESQKNKAVRKALLRKLRKLSPVKSASPHRSSSRSRDASASAAVVEFKVPESKAKSRRGASRTKRASPPPKPAMPSRSERHSRRVAQSSSADYNSADYNLDATIQNQSDIVKVLEAQLKEYNESASERMRTDSASQGIVSRSLQDFNKEEIRKRKEYIRNIRGQLAKARSTLSKLKSLKRNI